MEAKELINNLMIGDWFRGPDPTPIRITRIDSRGMLVENQDTDEVGLEDLQPIPLTEEILLKNGFEYNEDFEEYLISIYKNVFSFGYDSEDDFYYFGSWIRFYHVHELQNLLRLCGLTELVDDFKIE